jgi:peroxiredoxin-like protein
MATARAHRYPVEVQWQGGRLTRASSPGKAELEVATPPEFKGGISGVWSPEDLLVASAASCYAVTLVAVAERRGIRLYKLEVDATGHVALRDNGHFGFVAIELHVALETNPGSTGAAEQAARVAEHGCLVRMALDTPVHVEIDVVATPKTTALAAV